MKDWKVKHHDMLMDGGLEDGPTLHKFVSGIFMCTSAAKQTAPLLQTVYQADAAHMNFGKYTLYSCYGITVNCNTYPVAFGMVFGNEDKEGWLSFWKFAKREMPCLNSPETMIITDRDKGSIEAIDEVLPLAVNFFCSYHPQKNIQTYIKCGSGQYSCMWMNKLLLNCHRPLMGAVIHEQHLASICALPFVGAYHANISGIAWMSSENGGGQQIQL